MNRRAKGSGAIHQRADGLWIAAVELPPDPRTGRRRRKAVSAKRKVDVVRKLRELHAELERSGDLPTSDPKLGDYLEGWLKREVYPQLKPRSAAGYEGYVRRYLIPALGSKRLDKLTPADVTRMTVALVDSGLSSTTALQAHRVLQKALHDAMRTGLVSRNVAELATAPRRAVSDVGGLTAQRATAVLAHSTGRDRLRWAVALMLGVRQGEALGLRWEHVTLHRGEDGAVDGGVVELAWALSRLSRKVAALPAGLEGRQVKGALWIMRPKTRGSWRQVPLPAGLANMFAQAWDGCEWVFHGDDGGPVDPHDDWEAWRAALKRAGVPMARLHAARHTASTLLAVLGTDEATRMQILGHSSATTNRGYTHADLALALRGLDQVDGLLLPQIEP